MSEQAWNEKDEHKAVRTCQCFCGNVFKSQARRLSFIDMQPVKDADGEIKREKGRDVTKKIAVEGNLSFKSCPKCGRNRIKSFE